MSWIKKGLVSLLTVGFLFTATCLKDTGIKKPRQENIFYEGKSLIGYKQTHGKYGIINKETYIFEIRKGIITHDNDTVINSIDTVKEEVYLQGIPPQP